MKLNPAHAIFDANMFVQLRVLLDPITPPADLPVPDMSIGDPQQANIIAEIDTLAQFVYPIDADLKAALPGLIVRIEEIINMVNALRFQNEDGKWGRRTLMALVEFSSTNLGTVDLQSAAASKKLLDAVLR